MLGVLSLVFPLRADVPFSSIILARDGSVVQAFLAKDDKWRMKTELAEISPTLRRAIIAKEDRFFYWHFGVNPAAIVRALANNLLKRKTTSGASTLTMQVARMLENQRIGRNRERTVWNKCVELFRAFQLEGSYSKDEILQWYLNLAPYGGNIEGVKAASLLYFGTLPEKLSLAEATTLAIIPNRPTSLKLDEANAGMVRQERDKWLARFGAMREFPTETLQDALREPVQLRRQEIPNLAPHFGSRMKSAFADAPILRTTLDVRKQQSVQTIAGNVVRRLQMYGINNAAVLVVNNRTREVEAYLGSPNFADKTNAGEVDGVRAVRSPGSALKPLVYGLAMDKGLITPSTILTDVPSDFDGYAPENFDRQYRGFISAERALINSLNIPAVKLLRGVGVAAFTEAMQKAGFEQVRKDARKLGLSSVLGGCGVRLEEMAGLYAAFANEGTWKPLQFLCAEPSSKMSENIFEQIWQSTSAFFWRIFSIKTSSDQSPQTQILSRSATFMLGEILTQLTRPDVPHKFSNTQRLPKIAWKTGTSYGRRDAWSIGYNKRYTVAVWVGNFSGVGVPELVGADVATPLLFDIFNAIDYNSPNDWFQPPPELDFRLVCSESGFIPQDFCTNQISEYYIPRISSNQKCQHAKEVFVSADERVSYCTECLPQTGYKTKLYPNFPPEILSLYAAQNQVFERIPEHNPKCSRAFQGTAPVITSLSDGKEYICDKPTVISNNTSNEGGLMLTCSVANDVRTVYWFVNDKFYRTATPHERLFFVPERGVNKISCSDDKGRNTNIWIQVQWQ
ncbi:MAG: penicillin-binding protein 1C [Candidatus Kapaibacterium sp.]|nr:MAG: penicillin-binding protein 1C [Candidatus Kapabacteria bacterium]